MQTATPEPEVNPTLTSFRRSAETEALIRCLSSLTEGEMRTYQQLIQAAALPDTGKGLNRCRSALAVARKHLEERGMIFGAIHGVGIKRLVPTEIVELGTNTVQRARRLAKRGGHRLAAAPLDRLSTSEASAVRVQISQLAVIGLVTSRATTSKLTQAALTSGSSFGAADALKYLQNTAS